MPNRGCCPGRWAHCVRVEDGDVRAGSFADSAPQAHLLPRQIAVQHEGKQVHTAPQTRQLVRPDEWLPR